MSEHMEKPHTENIAIVTWHGANYALPVGKSLFPADTQSVESQKNSISRYCIEQKR